MLFTGQLFSKARLFLVGSKQFLLDIQKFEKHLEITTEANVCVQVLVRS